VIILATITVTHLTRQSFEVETRGHKVVVDQPHRGREEAGPSPTELFVAGLAACVGHYAGTFLYRHELPYDGLRVECEWAMRASEPARVSRVEMRVTTPAPVPEELRDQLHDYMEQCTVHNSLRQPPSVAIDLTGSDAPAAQPA
jgi:putative redox protein